MACFYIIDQSMTKCAGHHFDYTRNIANSASKAGYETIVGAHVDLSKHIEQESGFVSSDIRCAFTNTTYNPVSYLPGLRKPTRSSFPPDKTVADGSWLHRRALKKHDADFEVYTDQFRRDFEKFVNQTAFKSEDHVFFVTISETELLGLAKYLASSPTAKKAHWHLQFHFEPMLGAPSDDPEGHFSFLHVQSILREAKRIASVDRLYLYTTSPQLTAQYNRLKVGDFETLAYPVNPTFFKTVKTDAPKRLITCAGGIRREKGIKDVVPTLAKQIRDDPSLLDQVQLVVQGKPSQIPWGKDRYAKTIQWEPMPDPNYADLIHRTSIGLLAYDRDTFASRVSSTLNEFMCAGKPVIVTSGTWLHHKILPFQQSYLKSLWEEQPLKILHSRPEVLITDRPEIVTIEADNAGDSSSNLLLMKALWPERNTLGSFGRLSLKSSSQHDDVFTVEQYKEVSPLREVYAAIQIDGSGGPLNLELTNAFEDQNLWLKDIQFAIIASDQQFPRSSVGLTVDDPQEIKSAVKHICDHFAHFETTAQSCAKELRVEHDPQRTLDQLLKRSA